MASCKEIMEYRNRNNSFSKYLGIRTTEMEPGFARGEMPVKPEFENAVGSVHGGCIFTLADTIGGAAAASHGNRMTTVSSDFHYLSPAIGTSKLYAVAKEIKHGKTISVYDVEILDDREKLIAKGTFSYFNLGTPILE